jgi:GNAT superfamily N-acetyltransferase
MAALTFHEITSLNDPCLLPWLDLFEISFPANEKVLVSDHLNILKLKEQGLSENQCLLAALDETGLLAGMARYELFPTWKFAFLTYLAIQAKWRGQGLGSTFYQEILRRIAPLQFTALILEVEIPQDQPDPDHQSLAARRIEFYQRQGALQLNGCHYLMNVGAHQPLTPMLILVHPFHPLEAGSAFELIQQIPGNTITQTGPLVFGPGNRS